MDIAVIGAGAMGCLSGGLLPVTSTLRDLVRLIG